MDADAIAAQMFKTLRDDPAQTIKFSGSGWIADRDVPKLLGMSSTKARELREAGEAWPRYSGIAIDKCSYVVFIVELAAWCAGRLTDAS